jgi:hypothetical protein
MYLAATYAGKANAARMRRSTSVRWENADVIQDDIDESGFPEAKYSIS